MLCPELLVENFPKDQSQYHPVRNMFCENVMKKCVKTNRDKDTLASVRIPALSGLYQKRVQNAMKHLR